MSCILAFYLAAAATGPAGARRAVGDADRRTSSTGSARTSRRAQQAADLWAARRRRRQGLRGDVEAARAPATGSARTGPTDERRAALERGVKAGEQAIAARRRRSPKDTSGWRPTWARSPSRTACRRAQVPRPDQGRARDACSRWIRLAAGIRRPRARLVVSPGARPLRRQRGEGRRRTCARRSPTTRRARRRSTSSPEVLLERGKKDEARKTLQQVLDAPLDPDWTPEDKDFKSKAT